MALVDHVHDDPSYTRMHTSERRLSLGAGMERTTDDNLSSDVCEHEERHKMHGTQAEDLLILIYTRLRLFSLIRRCLASLLQAVCNVAHDLVLTQTRNNDVEKLALLTPEAKGGGFEDDVGEHDADVHEVYERSPLQTRKLRRDRRRAHCPGAIERVHHPELVRRIFGEAGDERVGSGSLPSDTIGQETQETRLHSPEKTYRSR